MSRDLVYRIDAGILFCLFNFFFLRCRNFKGIFPIAAHIQFVWSSFNKTILCHIDATDRDLIHLIAYFYLKMFLVYSCVKATNTEICLVLYWHTSQHYYTKDDWTDGGNPREFFSLLCSVPSPCEKYKKYCPLTSCPWCLSWWQSFTDLCLVGTKVFQNLLLIQNFLFGAHFHWLP